MRKLIQRGLGVLLSLFIVKTFDSMKCGASISEFGKVLFACEDNIMHLTCPHRSLTVHIITAKYGRDLSKTYLCQPTDKSQKLKDCAESNVKSSVQKLCRGKSQCSFDVDYRNLGGYCINVYKHLSVFYKCVVRPTTATPPSTEPRTTQSTTEITTTNRPNKLANNTSQATNTTSNDTLSYSTSSSPPTEPVKITEISVTSRTVKPIIDAYDREVFPRSGGDTNVASGLHGISHALLSCLLVIVFNMFLLRIT